MCEITDYLYKFKPVKDKFWGTVTAKIRNGYVVLVRKEETIKFPDRSKAVPK